MRVSWIPVLLCLLLLVAQPVAAWDDIMYADGQKTERTYSQTSFTYDGKSTGDRLISIKFDVPDGGRVDYILYYGTSESVSGYTTLSQDDGLGGSLGYYNSTITLGGSADSSTFWNAPGITEARIATYWRNATSSSTEGIIVYSTGNSNHKVVYPVADMVSKLIYKVTITSDIPINIEYTYAPVGSVGKYATADDDLIETIKTFYRTVFQPAIAFLFNLVYWLRFFFIDNLGLVVTLYISVSMALAARAARGNIGKFYRTFISDQKKLFGFMFDVWRMLLETIGTVRGWFRL